MWVSCWSECLFCDECNMHSKLLTRVRRRIPLIWEEVCLWIQPKLTEYILVSPESWPNLSCGSDFINWRYPKEHSYLTFFELLSSFQHWVFLGHLSFINFVCVVVVKNICFSSLRWFRPCMQLSSVNEGQEKELLQSYGLIVLSH